jgi:hypothetical protein
MIAAILVIFLLTLLVGLDTSTPASGSGRLASAGMDQKVDDNKPMPSRRVCFIRSMCAASRGSSN